MDLPITIVAGTLPAGAVYNPQTYLNAIVARMSASVSSGNLIFGQLGGTQPGAPLPGNGAQAGLWFGNALGNSGIWQDYNTAAATYLPIPLVCGQYVNGSVLVSEILCGAITGSWKLVTPDKAGTIALLSDIPTSLGTQTLINSNWNNRAPMYIVQTAALTLLPPTNASDGQVVDYFIENATGGALAVNWWSTTHWPGNTITPPSTPVGSTRVIDHYRVQYQGGTYFAWSVAMNYQIAVGAQVVVPIVVSLTGSGSSIFVQFSANLQGVASVPIGDFNVIVNGVAATVLSALANGVFCLVNLSAALPASATVTLQYTGTDLKSIQGNNVAAFGPSAVALANVGTPSAPGGGGGLFNHYLT